jgi:hypothetical protein
MNLKISKMTGKLEGIGALNTNPLTNSFCIDRNVGICGTCYSKYSLNTYRTSCAKPFQKNSDILSSAPLKFIPYIETAIFRFNAHGELINNIHFANLASIAAKNKQSAFALWTKRADLVDFSIVPKNMNLVFSDTNFIESIDELEDPPDGFQVRFSVTHNAGLTNCHGKCKDCLRCWAAEKATIVCAVREVKKI